MNSKKLLLSLGAAAALGFNAQVFANTPNALGTDKLDKGYNTSQSFNLADAKTAEGKCGHDDKGGEGKCGEGKCGEGKCGS